MRVEKNQNIVKAIRKWRIVLFFFVIWQILLFVVLNVFVSKFAVNIDLDAKTIGYLQKAVVVIVLIIAMIQDIFFLHRIHRTKALLRVQPIKCVVEDFIINSYRRDGKTAYHVYLLLKDMASNSLYFTYGSYSLSFYNHTVIRSGYDLLEANIFRKDGSSVNLGDFAWLYIRKPIQITVKDDGEGLLLNGKKFAYRNVNNNFSPHDFFKLQFVEGAVDVETP